MSLFKELFWIFFLFFFTLIIDGKILKCLQCKSMGDEDCYYGRVPAVNCPSEKYTRCITYSGLLKETQAFLLFRNCTTESMSNGCQDLGVTGVKHGSNLRVCYIICETDGCNNIVVRANSASGVKYPSGPRHIHIGLLSTTIFLTILWSI